MRSLRRCAVTMTDFSSLTSASAFVVGAADWAMAACAARATRVGGKKRSEETIRMIETLEVGSLTMPYKSLFINNNFTHA
jgi:hypothetical protein